MIRKAKIYTDEGQVHYNTAAIKLIKNLDPEKAHDDISSFLREAYIMSQFDHVNVLSLMAIIWEQGEPPAVVTPYMGKGSLLNLIRKSDMVCTCRYNFGCCISEDFFNLDDKIYNNNCNRKHSHFLLV